MKSFGYKFTNKTPLTKINQNNFSDLLSLNKLWSFLLKVFVKENAMYEPYFAVFDSYLSNGVKILKNYFS